MKIQLKLSLLVAFLISGSIAFSQDHEIKTILGSNALRSSGGYGAITNKFTSINGNFANLIELYGGWYINHKFLIGLSGSSLTNNIKVPEAYRALPDKEMSYQYVQCGLITEYVLHSDKAVHLAFNLFNGGGVTTQYIRNIGPEDYDYDQDENYTYSTDWFYVIEPGISAELNLLKWMRFSPGVSYRLTNGSSAKGLSDSDLSAMSINMTLKFGKF